LTPNPKKREIIFFFPNMVEINEFNQEISMKALKVLELHQIPSAGDEHDLYFQSLRCLK